MSDFKEFANVSFFLFQSSKRIKLAGDTSIMTYTGHSVLQTLVRCRFSPAYSTGIRTCTYFITLLLFCCCISYWIYHNLSHGLI
jgi:hypothetical protein